MPIRAVVNADILRTLHRIHKQLTDLHERLERGPRQVRARKNHATQQEQQLAQAQADAKAFRVATDAKQLHFKSREDKLKELRVKLNVATSNREYQAVKEQMAADEMANSVLADEILEALEKVDRQHQEVEEVTASLKKAREELQRVEHEVQEREPQLQAEITRLEEELHQAESQLPSEVRDPYLRAVRQKGEEAMAPISRDGRYCGGCNHEVPVNLYNALKLGHPVFCKSCGVLLYLSEGDEVVHAPEE